MWRAKYYTGKLSGVQHTNDRYSVLEYTFLSHWKSRVVSRHSSGTARKKIIAQLTRLLTFFSKVPMWQVPMYPYNHAY